MCIRDSYYLDRICMNGLSSITNMKKESAKVTTIVVQVRAKICPTISKFELRGKFENKLQVGSSTKNCNRYAEYESLAKTVQQGHDRSQLAHFSQPMREHSSVPASANPKID
eukprot:TRINITY_DN37545_c0_g1_i1.p3 TRINITY_DN37545_c0_g1~~TRINITY_DN37545_c0_g1_i1.p3  ORF type:complete len:112 (+),score=26.56 TRINITY_DN37545_c0_g1_i1:196-531(+)